VDEAIACYRQTIAADSAFVSAYINLSSLLSRQGKFAEALEWIRRGHALGVKTPGWPYPSAMWVRRAERLAAMEKKLPAFRKGEYQPADNKERLLLAQVCKAKTLYRTAVSLAADAFAADAGLAENTQIRHRYGAARAAALAASGKGDAAKLDDKEKAELRKQALTWLRAELAALARQRESGNPSDRTQVQGAMRHLQQDVDLANLREEEAIARLPAEEREGWAKFWADVEALRKKAR
jgi:serine/threonine-protein kinase